MKNGGRSYGIAVAICEMFKTSWQAGKQRMKGDLENHLKDRLFHLVRWLNIVLFPRKTSRESTSVGRKYYLAYSSVASCTRWEFGKETFWFWTLRSWRWWTHLKNMLGDSMQRRSWHRKNRQRFYMPHRSWNSKTFWRRSGPENIHLDTGSSNSRRTSSRFSGRIRRVSANTSSRLTSGCGWGTKWFLVLLGRLHLPPSRWTECQALHAERRNIFNSTQENWRLQGYPYDFGWKAASMIFGTWMDQEICLILRQVSHNSLCEKKCIQKGIHVVWVRTDETASNIQAWPFVARNLEKYVKELKTNWTGEKPQLENARRMRGIYFIDLEDKEFKEIIMNALRKLEVPTAPAMPCKKAKRRHGVTRSRKDDHNSKFASHFGSRWIQETTYGRKCTKKSWRPSCRKRK